MTQTTKLTQVSCPQRPAKRRRLPNMMVALLLVGALGLAGCGSKVVTSTSANGQVTTQTVPNIHFANTKFVLHMGLAFGAIHRYIYKPLRNGAFRKGAPGRVKAFAKAAAAALFAVHELRVAHRDALASNQLRPLANKLDGLGTKLSSLVHGLRNGNVSLSSIASSVGAAGALGSASKGLGVGIKDISSALG